MPKFPMGRLSWSHPVNEDIADNAEFAKYVLACLRRYANGDWGASGEHDARRNDEALHNGTRIFATYTHEQHSDWKIFIITEADRSYTTVLYPSDY